MSENPAPPYESYVERILDALRRSPEHTALITAEGRAVPAGELHEAVLLSAAALAEHGVRRGSTVSLLVGDRPEALVARYAANLLGARVVSLGLGSAPGTQAAIVDSVGTAALLVDPDLRTAGEALLALVRVPAVLTLDSAPTDWHPAAVAGSALRPGRTGTATGTTAGPKGAAQAEDDWCIRFTGGTTGIPKGIRMAHGPYGRLLVSHAARLAPSPPPRFLACTALAHMAGIVADATLLAGGTVVLRSGFDPLDVITALERERITDLWLLPPLLYELLDHPALATADLSALRRVFYGGTPASAERLHRAAELLGPVLYGWYGQTEAGNITEVLPHEHGVTGPDGRITVGRAQEGVEIEIRDPRGAVLPTGRNGEIHVRTPMLMSGYWRRPDLTAQVLRDGWISTGDVGHLDGDGFLHLVDRLKEMVIVVGGHVYPAEVEQVLLAHPAVAQCAAFGTRRADGSEELQVAVVPAAGHRLDRELVRGFVTERLGSMYAPAAVHVLDRLPLTEAGKPDRKLLRATLGPDHGQPDQG
ncbi:AMP-binding protein [Kitasatospora sp. NPDC088351]|uniref:AMP-binding protein n=1 Tax=Kitasatospora sp. NPDC088351 TaxID=3155180 RepID=UPI003437C718